MKEMISVENRIPSIEKDSHRSGCGCPLMSAIGDEFSYHLLAPTSVFVLPYRFSLRNFTASTPIFRLLESGSM
jgi:hypothetical protein